MIRELRRPCSSTRRLAGCPQYHDSPDLKVASITCIISGKNALGSVLRGLLTICGSFISGAYKFVERGENANRTVLTFNTSENAEIVWYGPALEYTPHATEGETIYALLVGPVEDFWISESNISCIQQGLALRCC